MGFRALDIDPDGMPLHELTGHDPLDCQHLADFGEARSCRDGTQPEVMIAQQAISGIEAAELVKQRSPEEDRWLCQVATRS
ncbi:MAG: hypothetical protein ABIJ09_11365 [Pseudomonadota bacterium]